MGVYPSYRVTCNRMCRYIVSVYIYIQCAVQTQLLSHPFELTLPNRARAHPLSLNGERNAIVVEMTINFIVTLGYIIRCFCHCCGLQYYCELLLFFSKSIIHRKFHNLLGTISWGTICGEGRQALQNGSLVAGSVRRRWLLTPRLNLTRRVGQLNCGLWQCLGRARHCMCLCVSIMLV